MAQFYTLEEAARVLGMSPDELKGKAQHREIRAFQDSGSWQFRVADVDELARRRGLGSDPDFSLSDPELSLSDLDLGASDPISGSGEVDLSEFQLGTARPNLGQPSMEIPASRDEDDVLLDDLSVPHGPGAVANSSSTILGMHPKGKLPSDSDVRLVPGPDARQGHGASDSDVRLSPQPPARRPGDSDVTLVNDDLSSMDFPAASAARPKLHSGSSADHPAQDDISGSDFEVDPSRMVDALQPESGSDFELSAVDGSDEFESTPLAHSSSDSDVTAAAPADSGINLGRPSDSGINLGAIEGVGLDSADSIELSPLDDDGPQAPPSKPKSRAPEPSKPKSSLSATPPPATRKGEKDIFEDTDFEVDALGSGEGDDRTMQLEAASDFDLDEADSASEVFAIDEDDVDENASTAMAPALLDDESGEFDSTESSGGGLASSGWDVDSEPVASSAGSQGTVIPSSRNDNAEWGGLWVGFLGVGTVLTLLAGFISIDLIRNLYDFRSEGPASGIIKSIAGLFG